MGDTERRPGVPGEDDSTRDDALDTGVPESVGPIQMTTLAFPGNDFRGEILPELDKLKKAGIVRIVDLLLVRKDELDNVMVTTGSGRDREGRDGRRGRARRRSPLRPGRRLPRHASAAVEHERRARPARAPLG